MNSVEIFILVVIVLLVIFVILPAIYNGAGGCSCNSNKENFTAIQEMDTLSGIDPDGSDDGW